MRGCSVQRPCPQVQEGLRQELGCSEPLRGSCKGKGGAPQAPPAGKGPQTRRFLQEGESFGPCSAKHGSAPFSLRDAQRRRRSQGPFSGPLSTDFVQTTEELMGKDPSASLTKMALADTNVLSDDVAQELAAKTAQLDSLDQAVLSLQGDIQLKSSAPFLLSWRSLLRLRRRLKLRSLLLRRWRSS